MRRLYVQIDWPDFDALARLARDERRHPSDQAAILLKQALVGQGRPSSKAVNEAEVAYAASR